MMTLEQVLEVVAQVGDDVSCDVSADRDFVRVTVQDFEGFDEDWCEVDRDYDCKAVEVMEAALKEGCASHYNDYYSYYEFEGFTVQVGYESMDI